MTARSALINASPIVPAATLGRLKGLLERGQTDAKGAGFGLAVADAIVASSGAKLDFISPATNREDGFEATLALPHLPPDP